MYAVCCVISDIKESNLSSKDCVSLSVISSGKRHAYNTHLPYWKQRQCNSYLTQDTNMLYDVHKWTLGKWPLWSTCVLNSQSLSCHLGLGRWGRICLRSAWKKEKADKSFVRLPNLRNSTVAATITACSNMREYREPWVDKAKESSKMKKNLN